jgi:hypothetical protein
MPDLIQWSRREGLTMTLPDVSRIVVRATGTDEYVIELDGMPIWSDEANLRALGQRIYAALTVDGGDAA